MTTIIRKLALAAFDRLPLSVQLGIFVRYAADHGWQIKRVTLPMPQVAPPRRVVQRGERA